MSFDARLLLEVAVELGILQQQQVVQVRARQMQLQRGGVVISVGQTLLERKLVTTEQLRQLTAEVAFRKTKSNVRSAVKEPAKSKVASFANYELIEILSEKQHCRVFKARDTSLDRLVVLKVLPSSMAKDPQWSERFKREMQLAGKLTHPNIATAYGSSEVDGNSLMVLEFIDGVALGDRLDREGNLHEKTTWMIAREVAKGLAFAAKKGILHRDIKPDNIICGIDGSVKIIDMGLSKALNDSSGLTSEGTTVGTPFYISPEQSRGTANLDARTDIYSLGCTVYHMLTGTVPFLGEKVMDIMVKHVEAPRPDPRGMLPEISEASANLVMRMMASNPDDRPASAEDLVAEIEELLPNLPEPESVIRPVTLVEPSPSTTGMTPVNNFAFEPSAPMPTPAPVQPPGTRSVKTTPPSRTVNMTPPTRNVGVPPPRPTRVMTQSSARGPVATPPAPPEAVEAPSAWRRITNWLRRPFG